MGEFSDLNPNASWKEDHWNGIKDDMEKILNELNSDIFSEEYWWIEVDYHGVAPLLKPNLVLTDGLNYISIGMSHDKDKIRVLVCTGFKWVWEDKYYAENTILKYRDTVLIVKRLTKWLLDHRRV